MPKALVINPNTSPTMTAEIEATSKRVFNGEWSFLVKSAPAGPESLESWIDYHLASVNVLPLIINPPEKVDGIVLACFGDPGLYALKEIAAVPLVGIAEASLSISLLLGGKFGILAGMERAVELMDSMVRLYGLENRYAGCVPLNMRVLSFDEAPEETLNALSQAALKLEERGADVLILGCAGLTAFVNSFRASINLPVIDPVEAGGRILKTIVESGLYVSHAGLYTRPARQQLNSLEIIYSNAMIHTLRSIYPFDP